MTSGIVSSAVRAIDADDVALCVVVKPGQKKEGFSVGADGSLVLRVNAPALEGRANERVVACLAKILGCAKGDVSITRGEQSRHKEIRIKNLSVSDVVEALVATAR